MLRPREWKNDKIWLTIWFCLWDFRTHPCPKDISKTCPGHFQLRTWLIKKILVQCIICCSWCPLPTTDRIQLGGCNDSQDSGIRNLGICMNRASGNSVIVLVCTSPPYTHKHRHCLIMVILEGLWKEWCTGCQYVL